MSKGPRRIERAQVAKIKTKFAKRFDETEKGSSAARVRLFCDSSAPGSKKDCS